MTTALPAPIETAFTRLMGCAHPIIAAPMFLVSNEAMVIEASNAGGIGATPSLNWRRTEQFDEALGAIRAGTDKPYAVNLIVNKSNIRAEQDLEAIVRHKVPMVITSLGNPQRAIEAVHGYGGKVFCDITTLPYAQKVQDLGADGVIAVSSGAGGHAGHISPLVLLPYLKEHLSIPIVAAGGIVTGRQILAAMVLGADAVSIGTRFIASAEAHVSNEYKQAVVNALPEDIVLTSRISGTPAAVINTPFVQKIGTDLPWYEKTLLRYPAAKKYLKLLRYIRGSRLLDDAANKPSWKTVWSAGQGAGLVHDIQPVSVIVQTLAREYWDAKRALSQ